MRVSKASRQSLVLELCAKSPAPSQEALRRRLARSGIRVNQATLSRDLRELGLFKTAQGYALPAHAPGTRRTALADVYEVRVAQNLVVLRTPPGRADMCAIDIDRCGDTDVLGTIAGDDTIFVATPTPAAARRLAKRCRAGEIG